MMIVDEKVFGPVKEEDLDTILSEAKKGDEHPTSIEKQESHYA